MLVENPDTIGKNLCELNAGDSGEFEFGSIGDIHCEVQSVNEETDNIHREVLLEADNGDRITVEVELLQRTRPNEPNHYENRAYILSEQGKNPFSPVTDLEF